MKKRESSFKFLAVVIALAIAGILLISAVSAYWVEEMKVEMEIDNHETSDKKVEITRVKGEEASINFRATIDCQSRLDIIAIDKDENVFLIFSSDSPGDYRNRDACEIRESFVITPEETIEDYDVIFLSPGIDNYGMDKTIQELLEYWQSLESKTSEVIIDTIRSNTVSIGGSNDLMTTRKIKVRTEDPQIDIKIEWTDDSKTGIKVYGIINLPENTAVKWRFSGPFMEVEGETEIDWNWGRNRNIEFTINDITPEKIKGGNCKISIFEKAEDEDGNLIIEENILPSIQKTTPTIEKPDPLPVSRSASSEILKPWPSPTIIPGIKEEPETPGITWIATLIAILIATIIIKRKKHLRDQ